MTPQLATVVMYHLVQPPDAGPVAGLKSVDVAAFRGQVAYIRRHLAQEPANTVTSRWRYSLMNWGHDPLKG